MDRDSDRRDSSPARRRSFAQESARSLRQRHQLVQGVGTMTLYFRGTTVPVSRQLSHTSFGKSALALLLMSASMLAGCSHLQKPPEIALDDPAEPAVLQADPPAQVEVVELPKPLPLPGQLKPLPGNKHTPEAADPAARVNQANAAARVQPVRNGFINAVQVYPFTGGALYQVYTAPGQITDVALQAGEQLTGSGPVAAGDTVRWIIGDTESGIGAAKHPDQADPTRSRHQSRHQHRSADLFPRTTLDREDLHGLGVLAVSGRPAHCLASSERGGCDRGSGRRRHRCFKTALPLRHHRRQSAVAAALRL